MLGCSRLVCLFDKLIDLGLDSTLRQSFLVLGRHCTGLRPVAVIPADGVEFLPQVRSRKPSRRRQSGASGGAMPFHAALLWTRPAPWRTQYALPNPINQTLRPLNPG